MRLGRNFGAHFLRFFHKNISYLILYQLTKFQCHTFFPSQDIKQNALLNSYFGNWWRHKLFFSIYYLRSSSKAIAAREMEGQTEIQIFEYLEKKKSYLDEIKNIFHNYLRTIIW